MENRSTIGKRKAGSGKRFRQAVDRRNNGDRRQRFVMRLLIGTIFVLAGVLVVDAANEPGIIKGSDQFEFVYRVKLPEIKGDACVWIPLAKTDAFQTVTAEELSIPIKWEKVQDRDYGNDICVLHPQSVDSG